MSEFFVAGGHGMYPTLMAGLGLLVTSLRYARRPEARCVPLMCALGLFTLFAGGLGFVTGLAAMLHNYTGPMASHGPVVLFHGLREALNNLILALALAMLAAMFASLGAWRLSRQRQAGAAG